MYPSSGATLRADLNIKVEEAAAADGFFIGHLVMPEMDVEAKSGQYPKLKIANAALLTAGSTIRQRGGSYGEVSRAWDSDTYDCIDRGLEEPVDDTDTKDISRFFNLEVSSAKLCMRNVHLDHETRVAAAIQNTGNFASTNSTVAYTTANKATMDPTADILAAIDRVEDNAASPDTMVIPKAVFTRITQATLFQNWVRGTLKGNVDMPINAQNIQAAFADYGIKRVLIGRARVNTAKKGQALVISQVWSAAYIWIGCTNPTATTPQDGGAGFTMVWNAEGGLFVTETYRDEKRRSNMVRVRQNTAEKITDATAGTLIATQYS
jgi:hypothetical protein